MSLPDLEVALAAANAGADVVAAHMGEVSPVRLKGAVDPVTEVDEEAERAILALVREARPDDAILAEEGGGGGWERGRVWIVDPLDGTVNFVHGIPHVSVSVALWEDGSPLAGVVVDVARREVFQAVRGGGASCDGTPLRVSPVTDPSSALVATGFPYDRQQRAQEYARSVAAVLSRFQGIRRFGSAALDLCWVAAGRYEGYWEHALGPWDAAAGLLVAREAGALVTSLDGAPYRLDGEGIVAAVPALHEELRATVRASGPSG